MIHRTYTKLLQHHSSGHALYSPVPAEQIRPGSLGYFDGMGCWHSLAHDIKSVAWPVRSFDGELRVLSHEPYGVDVIASEGIENFKASIGVSGTYTIRSHVVNS